MTRRSVRFHAACFGLFGALGALLLGSPGCSRTSGGSGEAGAAGGEGPLAGTSGSSNSSGTSSGASEPGGAASGATHTGGAAEPAGGSDGEPTPSAGSGSGGEAGGPPGGDGGGPECETSDDCVVLDDCCSCEAIPKSEQRGECEKVCVQSACSAQGLSGVTPVCVGNRCVFDVSCDRSAVTCKIATPTCDAGLVPSVEGECYGPCIAPEECNTVTDCSDCLDGQVCVSNSLFLGLAYYCVEVSRACAASPTCECTDACLNECSDSDGIACFCVAC
jgi:hypothetical protein